MVSALTRDLYHVLLVFYTNFSDARQVTNGDYDTTGLNTDM